MPLQKAFVRVESSPLENLQNTSDCVLVIAGVELIFFHTTRSFRELSKHNSQEQPDPALELYHAKSQILCTRDNV